MITGVLLAAGGARRFRSQKLVAMLRGVPIVRHSALALGAVTDSLIVVVGSEADVVARALGDVEARIVRNDDWLLGLSTSIRAAVAAVDASCEAIVIGVGDQPGLSPQVVEAVIARWRQSKQPIVSASYRGVRGHPVLFSRDVFAELGALDGDAGARLLIERTPSRVSYVDVDAEMPPDIDTVDDLSTIGDS